MKSPESLVQLGRGKNTSCPRNQEHNRWSPVIPRVSAILAFRWDGQNFHILTEKTDKYQQNINCLRFLYFFNTFHLGCGFWENSADAVVPRVSGILEMTVF